MVCCVRKECSDVKVAIEKVNNIVIVVKYKTTHVISTYLVEITKQLF